MRYMAYDRNGAELGFITVDGDGQRELALEEAKKIYPETYSVDESPAHDRMVGHEA